MIVDDTNTITLRDLNKYSQLIQGLAEVPVNSLDETKTGSSNASAAPNLLLTTLCLYDKLLLVAGVP